MRIISGLSKRSRTHRMLYLAIYLNGLSAHFNSTRDILKNVDPLILMNRFEELRE